MRLFGQLSKRLLPSQSRALEAGARDPWRDVAHCDETWIVSSGISRRVKEINGRNKRKKEKILNWVDLTFPCCCARATPEIRYRSIESALHQHGVVNPLPSIPTPLLAPHAKAMCIQTNGRKNSQNGKTSTSHIPGAELNENCISASSAKSTNGSASSGSIVYPCEILRIIAPALLKRGAGHVS